MASAMSIPPSHVGTHSFQHDAGEPDPIEFPQLRPADAQSTESEDWEMVPGDDVDNDVDEAPAVPPPQVKFQLTKSQAIRQDEKHGQKPQKLQETLKVNPKKLLHSQSSPNLRDYTIEESDSDSEFEHVEAAAAQGSQDDASSNFSLVSGPPSVNSIWSSRISFKDALLKKEEETPNNSIPENSTDTPHKKPHGQHIKKIKPKFIVQQVAPLKHAKSMGDLSKLSEEDDIMGDTDAHEYYSRKAQGSLGRRNGRKQRPDEKKRLQITMNKKNLQRARQGL
mmetsp:Transcript_19786/g.48606  ORF Transcript_19786/g.48606 Transcript_19786/m.48606 type:complete len:280 (-) Transcript_19786:185-1024(-)